MHQLEFLWTSILRHSKDYYTKKMRALAICEKPCHLFIEGVFSALKSPFISRSLLSQQTCETKPCSNLSFQARRCFLPSMNHFDPRTSLRDRTFFSSTLMVPYTSGFATPLFKAPESVNRRTCWWESWSIFFNDGNNSRTEWFIPFQSAE